MFTLLCAISIQILKFFCKDRRLLLYMSRTLHLFGTDWCAMMVPIQVIRWYRMQCYDGTDSCATVVPIRRYCHIIHALVFEDRILDYEEVIGIAKQYDERIVPFVDLAYHEGLDSLCLDDEKSMGYTLRTLGAALWAYWHATSYKEGILKIVLSGGDADTNAAVAGAILGAKFGICHIPDEWKSGLLYASMLHNKVQEFYAMYR